MSSRDDDADGNSCGTNRNDIAIQQPRYITKTCVACNLNSTVFLYRKDCVCGECLIQKVAKRVRWNLFKSRPERHERLSAVYGFTGSVSSVVLLDILNEGLDPDRSDLSVVHIDLSSIFHATTFWTPEMTTHYHNSLRPLVDSNYGGRWKLDIVKLEDVLGVEAQELQKLYEHYSADITSLEDLVQYLIRSALIKYARDHHLHRILTSQTASTLAAKIISSCAKGRGFQLAEESVGIEPMPDIDMLFVLPMQENLVDREIAYYYWKRQLSIAVGPKTTVFSYHKTRSINGITENFMLGLQRGFDHSVHTVLRSVEKLTSQQTSTTITPTSSATSSKSSSTSSLPPLRSRRCALCTRLLSSTESYGEKEDLCFGCNKLLSSGQDPAFPISLSEILDRNRDYVLAEAAPRDKSKKQHQMSRKHMKSKIQDALIVDEDATTSADGTPSSMFNEDD